MGNCLDQKVHYIEREMSKLQSVMNEKFDTAYQYHEETKTTEQDDRIDMKEQGPTFAKHVDSTQSEIENMV